MGRKDSRINTLRRKRESPSARRGRSEDNRPVEVRFLIVCEGEKTEPNYFRALINNCNMTGSTVRTADIKGAGRGTCSLVREAQEMQQELERKNAMTFDSSWVVFDKDDFSDFDQAIHNAEQAGFKSAWSNESFELWYFLHFHYLDAQIHRNDYIEKLEKCLRKEIGKGFSYRKNDPGMYGLLQEHGNEEQAKKWACDLRDLHIGKPYSAQCPCTMVDRLVNELEHPEALLSRG